MQTVQKTHIKKVAPKKAIPNPTGTCACKTLQAL